MGISRQVLKMWQSLVSEHGSGALFGGTGEELLKASPEYQAICRRLQAKTDEPDVALMLAVRSLSVMHSELEEQLSHSELVVTFPGGTSSNARPTQLVIRDMLKSARSEIILVGYRITSRDIVELLHAASRRPQMSITLICSRQESDGRRLLDEWPDGCGTPVVYEDREQGAIVSLMHIKLLLVDQADLLVSSANFTFSAMTRNFELGVRTTGKTAREARKVLIDLVESGTFLRLS